MSLFILHLILCFIRKVFLWFSSERKTKENRGEPGKVNGVAWEIFPLGLRAAEKYNTIRLLLSAVLGRTEFWSQKPRINEVLDNCNTNRGVNNRGLTVPHESWAYQTLASKAVNNRGPTVLLKLSLINYY